MGVGCLGQGEATRLVGAGRAPERGGAGVSWVLAYIEIRCFLLLLCLLPHPAGSRKKQEKSLGV